MCETYSYRQNIVNFTHKKICRGLLTICRFLYENEASEFQLTLMDKTQITRLKTVDFSLFYFTELQVLYPEWIVHNL
jgi:hypothetical protein